MATLNQGTAGLQGWSDPTKTRKVVLEKKEPLVEQRCVACRCEVPHVIATRSRKKVPFIDGMCPYCAGFFGHEGGLSGYTPGATNVGPQDTLQKIKRLREDNFLILLRNRSLVARDGNIVNLGAGDIFQCAPTNPEPDPEGQFSKDRTWALFTLNLAVGPYEIRLFAHEWSPISFRVVMELKSAGEMVESFIDDSDKIGHFTPTPEMREQIEACFGRLVNS
jgi:hypothetical protein